MNCKGKHYSSVWHEITATVETTINCSVTFPVVLFEIKDIKCRYLRDNRAWVSYTSSTQVLSLIVSMKKQSVNKENRNFTGFKYQKKSNISWLSIFNIKCNLSSFFFEMIYNLIVSSYEKRARGIDLTYCSVVTHYLT